MKDFFISYTSVDETWASWVAWVLEEAGYSVVVQAWDFRPGSNFVLRMQQALEEAERIVAILTPAYVKSKYGKAEWAAVLAADPMGEQRKVIPVRVAPCEPEGLLRAVAYIDLVGLGGDEERARKKLVEGMRGQRAKPEKAPSYPGSLKHQVAKTHPVFPAEAAAPPPPRVPSSSRSTRVKALPGVADEQTGVGYQKTPPTAKIERWQEYMREQIPPFFGLEFSEALWHAGFVAFADERKVFLLVTLEKRLMSESFQYEDRFLSPSAFQWQSQNRTSQEGKHGLLLRNHEQARVDVHLFVRAEKKIRSRGAAPFLYCGPVRFQSWHGDKPITVIWKLDEPVPPHLREALKVPHRS